MMRLSLLLALVLPYALFTQKQTYWPQPEGTGCATNRAQLAGQTPAQFASPTMTDTTAISAEICFGETYLFNDDTLTTSGQYEAIFTDVAGGDSIVTLDLTVYPFSGSELDERICSDEFYVFNGDTLLTSGVYTALYTDANGCDSTVTLHLTALPELPPSNVSATICAGESYVLGNDTLTESGFYTALLSSVDGCDSLVILTLTALPGSSSTAEVAASFCSGDGYEFNGDTLTQGGVYTALLTNEAGCDSTVTLTLTELTSSLVSLEASICAGETYGFEGDVFTESGVYTAVYTNAVGCDSTITLTLTVLPTSGPVEISATICAGESYVFNGDVLTESGAYSAVFTNAVGCDSTVNLTLTALPGSSSATEIEASICSGDAYEFNGDTLTQGGVYTALLTNEAGCDSTVTLTLTELSPSSSSLEASICAGESYGFEGDVLTEGGVYTAVYANAVGCDSTITLTLTVLPTSGPVEISATICAGESYVFNGDALTESGVYSAVFTNEVGCDSIVNLTLTALPGSNSTTEIAASFCTGGAYAFNGDTLTQGGVYTALLTSEVGCDSTVILTLTELATSSVSLEASICAGESYGFEGDVLTEGGVYTAVLTNAVGCDSTITLVLTVLPNSAPTDISASICAGESYAFNGDVLTESGVYTAVLTNEVGCDSTVILTLTALPPAASSLEASICAGESYGFEGDVLTESGVYTAVLTNEAGCDSTITLTLTVLPNSAPTNLSASICAGESYPFNGETLTEGGTYTAQYTNAVGCDSTVILALAVLPNSAPTDLSASICAGESYAFNGDDLTETGVYAALFSNEAGCDSLVVLVLTVLPPAASSLEVSICDGESYDFDGNTLTESGTYTALYTDVNGCDSTVTLVLTVLSASTPTNFEVSICSNDSYVFNGDVLTESGVYSAVFTNVAGCDSLVNLTLTVLPGSSSATAIAASFCGGDSYDFNGNILTEGGIYTDVQTNVAGCDSTITLTLTELMPSLTLLEESICAGETFTFDGQDLTESGAYSASYTNVAGCDSIVVLNLNVQPALASAFAVTICEESSYDFYGDVLTLSGIYTTILSSVNGCDSTITLTLTVREPDLTLLEESICEGQSYVFNGESLSQPGFYTALLSDSEGCDSLVILTLSVLPAVSTAVEASFCEGSTYDFNGQILTAPGVYVDVLSSASGCDSTVVLTLSVLQPDLTLLEESICTGQIYSFNGEDLTEAGTYTAVYPNINGCDSIVILNLSLLPVSVSVAVETICAGESFGFNGEVYTETGVYVFVLTNTIGCDSTDVLNLTVLPAANETIEASICPGESYSFNGEDLTESGVYTLNLTSEAGCDSTVTLNLQVTEAAFLVQQEGQVLTVEANDATYQWIDCATNEPVEGATGNIFAPMVTGSYAVIVTQAGCPALSDCFAVTVVGTEEHLQETGWQLSPNPTSGPASLQLNVPAADALRLQVFDMAGRLCVEQNIPAGQQIVPVDLTRLSDGVFLVRLSGGAYEAKTQRLVKATN